MTQAERDLILSKDIDSFVVIHSFSAAILLPWFYTSAPPPHQSFYEHLGKNMARLTKLNGDPSNHFSYGQPYEVIGYNASGSSSDWVYGKLNKMAIAVEMEPIYGNFYTQDGFHPSPSKIKTCCDDFYEAMLYFLETSDSILKPKNQSYDQSTLYIVWGHVSDEMGNPILGAKVELYNNDTGERIYAYTDENGFYMLNLATMNHRYNSSTKFTLLVGDVSIDFQVDDNGRKHVELTASNYIPELSLVPVFPVGIIILVAIANIYKRRN